MNAMNLGQLFVYLVYLGFCCLVDFLEQHNRKNSIVMYSLVYIVYSYVYIHIYSYCGNIVDLSQTVFCLGSFSFPSFIAESAVLGQWFPSECLTLQCIIP